LNTQKIYAYNDFPWYTASNQGIQEAMSPLND